MEDKKIVEKDVKSEDNFNNDDKVVKNKKSLICFKIGRAHV